MSNASAYAFARAEAAYLEPPDEGMTEEEYAEWEERDEAAREEAEEARYEAGREEMCN